MDLERRPSTGAEALLAALGKQVIVLHPDAPDLPFELSKQPRSPEDAIARFCTLIEKLPAAARARWDDRERRCMNIGIQSGSEPFASEFALSAGTLRRLVALRAEVIFTVYAPREGSRRS